MKIHEVFLDLYPEIERHIQRLKVFTVIDMVYELLNEYRDDLNKICCSDRYNVGKCIVDCNIDEIKNILHRLKDEIRNDEFSSQDVPTNCEFNINDIYDNEFLKHLSKSLPPHYHIELTSSNVREDLLNLLNDHRIGRGLCNSIDMSSNIPSMISSSVSFIANLIKDIIVMSQSYSLYNVSNSNYNEFGTHRSSKHPLWLSLYRYFIKRYIVCSNSNLSHEIKILVAAHEHELSLSYLLTYLLIKEKNIDGYLDFNELMRVYRELYFRYSSKEIIRSISNLSLKFNKFFQENKRIRVDEVISIIADYAIDKDKAETVHQSVCEELRKIGLREEDVEPLCYIVKFLRSILLFRKLVSTVLRSSLYLHNPSALPYLLLHTLMTVSGIQYLWLVVPSVKLELKLPQEDLMFRHEHEVDVLLLGFLPEVDVNGVRFTPSIAALEIKLTDISQKCCSKKDNDQECCVFVKQLLSEPQLNFITRFNYVCRNHKLSGIKCIAGVAIPCGDSMCRGIVDDVPFVCLEDLVSMGRFLVSLNELFYTFYSTSNSKQFSTPLFVLGL
ncbi:MAG: hypothetical protein QW101_07910 [Ignisphaera sp.]